MGEPRPPHMNISKPEEVIPRQEEISVDQIENIKEVFKLNRELEKIGTFKDYEKYLESIFPESKVKDIVWHNSDAEFKDEGFKPMKPNFDTLNSIEGVYNFSTNKEFVKRFGKNHYPAKLDIHLPLVDHNSGEYVDDMDRPLSEALFKIGKQKTPNALAPKYEESLKDTDGFVNYISGEEYIEKHPVSGREFGMPKQTLISVFNSSQIHILGSKLDIENFKNWMENQKKDKNETK